ncbi:fungal-specific transcription factor domain-containing protein [Thelonectria olida]|uniref:Fungal-specific transcription factor domain-containing protein n=1 Tax=Thelonectria olida TaxID=1576542 RepID=A0A9P8VS39_9HYPO|nr:fungal-specific transcription factor domain-containing protein [Thelonectria olida]
MPTTPSIRVLKQGCRPPTRIAQACHGCRRKKVRCDGTRPGCSRCVTAGIGCPPSGDPKRLALSRGSTKSLECRTRQLNAKVCMLEGRINDNSGVIGSLSQAHSNRGNSATAAADSSSFKAEMDDTNAKGDPVHVETEPIIRETNASEGYLAGASSSCQPIETSRHRISNVDHPEIHVQSEQILPFHSSRTRQASVSRISETSLSSVFCTRYVNIWFFEWDTLFPIVNKPALLHNYYEFLADDKRTQSDHDLAQLYLILNIAILSSDDPGIPQLAFCERQWRKALNAILMDHSLHVFQCLNLALLCSIVRADYEQCQYYKGIAVGLFYRLGLHQSQVPNSLSQLDIEVRRRAFWTFYTLDSFSAAITGIPRLLDDKTIEHPYQLDGDYPSGSSMRSADLGQRGRTPNALVLYHASRILAKALKTLYSTAKRDVPSHRETGKLETELNAWRDQMLHQFKSGPGRNESPADMTVNLQLALEAVYHYIRILIYRPALDFNLGTEVLVPVEASTKQLVLIMRLLKERKSAFSFCLPKIDLMVACTRILLHRSICLTCNLKSTSETNQPLGAACLLSSENNSPATSEKYTCMFTIPLRSFVWLIYLAQDDMAKVVASDLCGRTIDTKANHAQQQERLGTKSVSEGNQQWLGYQQKASPRSGNAQVGACINYQFHSHLSQKSPLKTLSPSTTVEQTCLHSVFQPQRGTDEAECPQLFATQTSLLSPVSDFCPAKVARADCIPATEWEIFLGSLDRGPNNIYDAIYGGQGPGHYMESLVSASGIEG